MPLLTAAIGGLGGPRPFKEATMAGGLALTFGLCLATANQFLEGGIPTASVTPYELTGCPPWSSSCAHLSASCQASTASGIGATRRGLVTPGCAVSSTA